jgi:hypothetical protein
MTLVPVSILAVIVIIIVFFTYRWRMSPWVEVRYRAGLSGVASVLEEYFREKGIEWTKGKEESTSSDFPPGYLLSGWNVELRLQAYQFDTWLLIGPIPKKDDEDFRALVEDIDRVMEEKRPPVRKGFMEA